jgi:hypothetical protein
MVAIARRESSVTGRSTGWFSNRLTIVLGAFVGGMVLVQMQTLFYDESLTITAAHPLLYATPGLRTSALGDQCRYYLAESAIPKSGLGIFTAVGVQPDQVVSIPDICIYVADTPVGIQLRTHSYGRTTFFGQFEGSNSRAACEGLATTMNTMPDTAINVKLVSPPKATNAGLDRRSSPGAGAITHYYGIQTVSLDTIVAGSELTHYYGDWDFVGDPAEYIKPVRPPQWLHEHGWCIDNIDIGPAVDPAMGRGAFATRPLPKGTMVAPAPMQVYPRRQDFTAKGDTEALIVNYCLQAAGSDILFYPYGPAVNLINHGSVRSHKANVAIRWAQDPIAHPQWLDLPLKEFWEMTYPGGIVLEVVALRDIRPGEELFLDYGNGWEEAWNNHVASWKPPTGNALDYTYTGEMDETAPLRTMKEQQTKPYAKNVGLMCNTPDWDREKSNKITWTEPQWSWGMEGYVNCRILERTKGAHGDSVYTVELMFNRHKLKYDPKIPMKDRYIDKKVPRRAIRFIDLPYSSDEHLPGVFRHPIAMPDDLFPKQWKKLSW